MTGFNLSLKNTTRFLPTPLIIFHRSSLNLTSLLLLKSRIKTSGSLAWRNDSPKHFSPDGWPVPGQGEDFVWQHNWKKLTGIEKQTEKLHKWRRANGSQYDHFHLVLLKSNFWTLQSILLLKVNNWLICLSFVSYYFCGILGETPQHSWELKMRLGSR